MGNLSEIITFAFYVVILVLCIFIIVHASLQIKNNSILLQSENGQKNKNKKKNYKMLNIIIIAIMLFAFMYYKVINNFSSYKANEYEKTNYSVAVAELNDALTLEFSVYGRDTYSSAEDLALSLDYRLPIKSRYYLPTKHEEAIPFSSYEVLKYNLNDFQNKPTLVSYDGVLMSIIKFKEGCKYINSRYIGKSDCIIEVDVNHYEKPNQIGQDRTLFAIDGINNTVKTDHNFFK